MLVRPSVLALATLLTAPALAQDLRPQVPGSGAVSAPASTATAPVAPASTNHCSDAGLRGADFTVTGTFQGRPQEGLWLPDVVFVWDSMKTTDGTCWFDLHVQARDPRPSMTGVPVCIPIEEVVITPKYVKNTALRVSDAKVTGVSTRKAHSQANATFYHCIYTVRTTLVLPGKAPAAPVKLGR